MAISNSYVKLPEGMSWISSILENPPAPIWTSTVPTVPIPAPGRDAGDDCLADASPPATSRLATRNRGEIVGF